MGRKIPAKKHRGVKDPLAQQAKRLESLKGKINIPPKDPDEQPMPQSLIRLFGLPDPKKKDPNKKKNHNKFKHLSNKKDDQNAICGSNPISQLRKLPGESGRGFSLRINSAMKVLHGPEEDLQYPQDLECEDYKGQRMALRREKRARRRAAGGAPAPAAPRPSRAQRAGARRRAAAEGERAERAEVRHEHVPFGEVASAPPALLQGGAGRRGPLPAGRRGLLLAGLLRPPQAAGLARQAAVDAYRALKASRRQRK